MTRSEELQLAISIARENVKSLKLHHISEPKIAQLTLDLLLAEQKRSDGCLYCQSGAFDKRLVGVYGEQGWNKYHIYLCGGGGAKDGEQFDYCPKCGKRLTEGKSV